MTNIAFIPVRGGSKSIPLKNIKLLNGMPLVYWTAKAANDAVCIDKVVIATDSLKIKETVENFNLSKVEIYERDKENAQDTSSTESVMLEYINNTNLSNDDYFFLIQATSPLLKSIDIDGMFETLKSSSADSVLSCVRNKRFYWSEEGKNLNYDYTNRPRRQDFKGLMMENGACYINKVGNIIKDKNRLSGKIAVYEMPEYTAIEIDEPDDFLIIEKLMNKYQGQSQTNLDIKLFLTDCDGVMTDGGMYYSENGDEKKKFNTLDGMAFELLRNKGIKTGIITGENTDIVRLRAKKIKADEVFLGVKNKLDIVISLCKKYNISLKQVAYIGDDINDTAIIKNIGLGCSVPNAMPQVKKEAKYITIAGGGKGAVREVAEYILKNSY